MKDKKRTNAHYTDDELIKNVDESVVDEFVLDSAEFSEESYEDLFEYFDGGSEDEPVRERSFDDSFADETAPEAPEDMGIEAEKSDVYFENLLEEELAQAQAQAEAELEKLEKRKKDKEKARKRDRKAYQEANARHEREMAEENERRMRQEAENRNVGAAPLPTNDYFSEPSFGSSNGEPSNQYDVPGSESYSDGQNYGYDENITAPSNTDGGVTSDANYLSSDYVSGSGSQDERHYAPERDGYPNAFSESEKRHKEFVDSELEARDRQRREENQAYFDKLNREGYERQRQAEDYKSFGSSGIDFSGNENHTSYADYTGSDVSGASAPFIAEREFNNLRENYEHSREVFKSYGDNVPKSVVEQYKIDAENYFSIERKISEGELRISRSPEVQQGYNVPDSGNSYSENDRYKDSSGFENPHFEVDRNNGGFGVAEQHKVSSGENPERYAGQGYDSPSFQSNASQPSYPDRHDTTAPLYSQPSYDNDYKGPSVPGKDASNGPVDHMRDEYNRQQMPSAPSPSFPENSSTITEKEYASICESFESSRQQFRSYKDNVPEAVCEQYKHAADQYFAVQRKIDNGELSVISKPSYNEHKEDVSRSSGDGSRKTDYGSSDNYRNHGHERNENAPSGAFNDKGVTYTSDNNKGGHAHYSESSVSYRERSNGVNNEPYRAPGVNGDARASYGSENGKQPERPNYFKSQEYKNGSSVSLNNASGSSDYPPVQRLNGFQQRMAEQAVVTYNQTRVDSVPGKGDLKLDVKNSRESGSAPDNTSSFDLGGTSFYQRKRRDGKDVPSGVVRSEISEKSSSASGSSGMANTTSAKGGSVKSNVSKAPVNSDSKVVGTQAFSERSKDNFTAANKRTGDRRIKPPNTPFQGSPIRRYDKLKVNHSYDFYKPIDRATRHTYRALGSAVMYAARSEQTGTANVAYQSSERIRDAVNTARVLKDMPRQLAAAACAARSAATTARNAGRFFEGKEALSKRIDKPRTLKQVNKELSKPFSSREMAKMQKKFGENALASRSQLNRKITVATGKNRALKAEINKLQAKGSKLTFAERKKLSELMAQKKVADQKLRNLHGAKKAQEKAFVRNRKAYRTTDKDVERVLKKIKKKNPRLSKKDKKVLSLLQDRKALFAQREKLMKALQARKSLRMSAGMMLGSAMRDSEDSTIQSIMRADRVLQNRYVRSMLKVSVKGALLPVKLAKKTAVGGYRAGRLLDNKFNHGRIGKKIDKGVNGVKSVNKVVKKAGEKALGSVINSRAFKGLNGGIYNRVKKKAGSLVPKKIKTQVKKGTSALNNINNKRKAILNKFKALGDRIKNSKLGKFTSAVSKGVGNVFSAFNIVKKALQKVMIYCAGFLIIVALIGAAITSVGGASTSLFLGDDGDDGKIDVSKYVGYLNQKEQKFLAEIDHIASDPDDKYEVITVNYQSGTLVNNFKEILSMTAVYFEQDFSDQEAVKAYMEQLYDDSHYYVTIESEPYFCSGCVDRDYKCTSGYDEFATAHRKSLHGKYADRGGCQSEKHTSKYTCGGCKTSESGSSYCPGHKSTYYTYHCDGHTETVCYGTHVDLDINVMVLGFDEIFFADSSINSVLSGVDSLGNVSKGDEIGTFTITHYCAEKYPHICNAGPPYKTASGTVVTAGRTIAVDKSVIPLGTHVVINGHEYIAEDTGGAIKGNRIDVAVATHAEALQKGKKTYKVYYAKGADESGSSEEAKKSGRNVSISYLEYAKEAANDNISLDFVLQAYGQAKEPEIAWRYDRFEHDNSESFAEKLQAYDVKNKDKAFSNAEVNTFEYVKMSRKELVALAKKRTGKDESKTSSFSIIANILIPYDKEHPDEYVVDPESSEVDELYFDGWTEENIEWTKNIYENLTKENYDGLESINQFTGGNVSYEGVVFEQGETDVVYYNQYDIRWKNLPYSSSTIGKSGCGPTSMAMIVSTLTDKTVDPIQMCNWASEHGYYVKGAGTAWSFISGAAANWGLPCVEAPSSQAVVDALSSGKLVVMCTGKGLYYTGDGHFVVLRGVDENNKILVADSASYDKSEKSWTLKEIVSGLKQWWIIG